MNQMQNPTREPTTKPDEREVSVIGLMIVLAKHKKLVAGLPMAVAVIATAVSFLLPNVYQATTKMLPPQQPQSGAAALLSQFGGAAGLAAGMAGLKNPSDLYMGMLKSRTIADQLIVKFDLKAAYDTELLERARKKLAENTSISSGKDGLITIEVEDKDQNRVAQLANAYVDELTKLSRTLALTEASQRRVFFERQLELAKNNLASAEVALKKGLNTRGVISVDVESRAIVETVGRLRAQVSAKEIQLSSMRAFVTESNPDYRRAAEELSSLRAELAKLENGRDEINNLSGDKAPVGLESIKLLRDVKYYQMLYELLAKQYEVARLDEAKDPTIVQVLDPAVTPERKFKPKRAIIIAISTILALLGAILWAFLRESRQRMLQSPENAAQWNEFKSYLRAKKV